MLTLIKGFAGKPTHAPLTDVSIGAYTVGVLMLILGYIDVLGSIGVEESALATGSMLAISGGLIVAIPTSLTGLLDWADLSKGSRARTLANYHLTVMILATASFAVTWVLQRPGYADGEVTTNGLIAGCVALGLLTLGGTLGGALAYVYGVRVVKKDVPIMDALIPGKISESGTLAVATPKPKKSKKSKNARTDFSDAQPAASPSREAPYVAGTASTPEAASQPANGAPAGGASGLAEYERYILSKNRS
jgi:uncharacterized membrane protein